MKKSTLYIYFYSLLLFFIIVIIIIFIRFDVFFHFYFFYHYFLKLLFSFNLFDIHDKLFLIFLPEYNVGVCGMILPIENADDAVSDCWGFYGEEDQYEVSILFRLRFIKGN